MKEAEIWFFKRKKARYPTQGGNIMQFVSPAKFIFSEQKGGTQDSMFRMRYGSLQGLH